MSVWRELTPNDASQSPQQEPLNRPRESTAKLRDIPGINISREYDVTDK